jgi:hypothetical protein
MSSFLLPLFSLVVGALLGLLSTVLASSIRQRHDVTLRLLDQYLQVRKEIVEAVSDLSNLDIRESFDIERRKEYRDSISKLYYKHYDFLPEAVLESLIILNVCLSNPNNGLYIIKEKAVVHMDDTEVIPFIESCGLFNNTKFLAPLALKSKNPTIRDNQAIILHARHVLYTLNKFASIEDLLSMTKKFKKAVNI